MHILNRVHQARLLVITEHCTLYFACCVIVRTEALIFASGGLVYCHGQCSKLLLFTYVLSLTTKPITPFYYPLCYLSYVALILLTCGSRLDQNLMASYSTENYSTNFILCLFVNLNDRSL